MDFLEYSDMGYETRGAMANGRLKFTDTHIVFKNGKTGKVEQISSSDIDMVTWQRFAGTWGLRIFSKSGSLHRFSGFKESEKEKVAKFFSNRYNNPLLEKELCLKGWNWGTAKFSGSVLGFEVANNLDFEVPLNYVSQCTTGKNEVTLEFHQNDDAPVSLMELRFHIPSSELAGDDPVDGFKSQVLGKASIISATGDAIAIFREVQCLTPRGRYDIKMFQSFFQLHGKTFDYKIPMSTVLRLFLLPHKDGRQTFFVVSLDPPIKQGQTRYHYLTFLFSQEEDEVTVELPLTDEELKSKYDGRLSREMSGPMFEVVSKIMKVMVNRKLTTPGQFVGNSGTPAVSCSYKAAAGHMYPLERGFIYVHKPPLHIRFEEITSVNFARSGGSTRSFDFEVETKSGIVHTFSSIEKEEYPKLFDFITSKKLRVKNRGKLDKPTYHGDFDNSDAEEEPDAYLARVKAEAKERSEDDYSDESEEDEDFNPDAEEKSDVAEEFDSNASSSGSSDEDGEGGSGSEAERRKEKKKKDKRDKPKRAKTTREPGTRKSRKKRDKKPKDANAPKRPQSAFFLWMNSNRESLKKKYPDLSITDFSRKCGEIWKDLKEKGDYEEQYKKDKEVYMQAMKDYVPTVKEESASDGEGGESSSKKSKPKKSSGGSSKKSSASADKKKDTSSPTKGQGAGSDGFKSKEFISDDDSSSGGGGDGDGSGGSD